ncbi:hypothetical protein HDV63DRAFT_380408 [Trichoderma sp. SZMC 28014]
MGLLNPWRALALALIIECRHPKLIGFSNTSVLLSNLGNKASCRGWIYPVCCSLRLLLPRRCLMLQGIRMLHSPSTYCQDSKRPRNTPSRAIVL